jgi:glycosyltransferase involved in cell wall biosynthesis
LIQRPRLHYHSDCEFFAGCENMIANFLNDERVGKEYDVSFSYRRTKRYEEGLRKRVSGAVNVELYPIVDGTVFSRHAAAMPKPLGLAIRGLNYLLLVRYWVLLWNAIVLFRAWRGRGIDVLHINNGGYPAALSCLSAAIAGRLCGIGAIVMVVNNIAQKNRYRYWWLDRPLDYVVRCCVTKFVTGSRNAGLALQQALRLSDASLLTLHNGIAVRHATETRAETRARFGLTENQLVFGMVALLEWRKGHRVLLNAIAELKTIINEQEMPVFLIEGDGPDRDELKQMVARLGVGNRVRFVGNERHIFDFVQALDVMLLPSVANEDFPNVILEAMSQAKPVIASRIAGTPEQIEDGVTGALVAPGDHHALALIIASSIRNKDSLTDMGRAGCVRFDTEFTADVAVSRYMNLYQTLINRREN